MRSLLSVRRTIRTLLLLTFMLLSWERASAVISYVNVCGLVSHQGISVPGIRVEARRCSDDAVVVGVETDSNPTNNYHLVYESLDDGLPGGQFSERYTPIPVYLVFSAPCTNIVISCADIAIEYVNSGDGKISGFNQTLNCATNPELISILRTGSDVLISFQSAIGVTYQLQQISELGPLVNWMPVPTSNPLIGTGGNLEIIQPIDPTARQIFYRFVAISP